MYFPLTTRVISGEADWDTIRSEWDALFAASMQASPALSFDWLRTWWRVYGPVYGTGGLRIVTVRREAKLVGVLPLYMGTVKRDGLPTTDHRLQTGARSENLQGEREGREVKRHAPCAMRHACIPALRFLSTGEDEHEEICPDYLNLLCIPGEESACADAAWKEIDRMDWECLELIDIACDSPLLPGGKIRSFSRGKCPIADLSGGFDAYLGRLSANSRQQARRLMREGDAAGVKFEIVSADRTAVAFEELINLHQDRWIADGKPGVFSAPRFVEFHRSLLKAWLPEGKAVVARLSLSGDPVAVLYGFINGKKFDFYQSGVRKGKTTDPTSPSGLRRAGDRQQTTDKGQESEGERLPTTDYRLQTGDKERRTKNQEPFDGASAAVRETMADRQGKPSTPRSTSHLSPLTSHNSHAPCSMSQTLSLSNGLSAPCHPHLRSPGNLAHLLLMKALAERGVTTYDFLRGSSSYKERLSTGENELVSLRKWRNTPRVAVYRAGELARRVGRKVRSGSLQSSTKNS